MTPTQTQVQAILDAIRDLHPRKYYRLSNDEKRFLVSQITTNTRKEINAALRLLKEKNNATNN